MRHDVGRDDALPLLDFNRHDLTSWQVPLLNLDQACWMRDVLESATAPTAAFAIPTDAQRGVLVSVNMAAADVLHRAVLGCGATERHPHGHRHGILCLRHDIAAVLMPAEASESHACSVRKQLRARGGW